MRRKSAEQLEFRRPLPVVVGNVDYRENEALLIRLDELLVCSGLEEAFIEKCLVQWMKAGREAAEKEGTRYREPSGKTLARFERMCRQALRCNIARQLTDKEYRRFSLRLAEGALLQWFCRIDRLEQTRVPTKSTLERYDKMLPENEIRSLVDMLNRLAVENAGRLELERALKMDVYLSDTTCVEANIHFPTDWVLLRDGVRTLIKAVKVIRKHGLRHRMPDPDRFLRDVNRLSIEMSQSRRRPDSIRRRKTVLRRLKRLTKLVKQHAERYSTRLQTDWRKETDLHEGEMKRIVSRIAGIVEQLPAAIRQAHERIIGGRKVENRSKILSLYEPDLHVIVRNKADAEVEFGNTLLLAEQEDGLLLDWKLEKAVSPGDIELMKTSLARMKTVFGRYPSVVGADRGFASAACHKWLEKEEITDAICPRSPQELTERMKGRKFRSIQKRRAQTEGRIGILKNDFLGRPFRSKGFEHRELAVTWAVFVHNLRLIARISLADEKVRQKAA
jgi:hypothetical protein